MKKNGFIFMESLTVLIVVLLATTMLLSSYSLYTRKSKERENYDLPSDRYLLFNIAKLNADSDEYSHTDGYIANRRDSSNPNSCENTPVGARLKNCRQVFIDNGLVYFIVIKDIVEELERDDITEVYDSGTIEYLKTLKKKNTASADITYNIDPNNSNVTYQDFMYVTKEYDESYFEIQRTTQTGPVYHENEGYIVGVFYKNNTYRYASIPLYKKNTVSDRPARDPM